MHIYEAHSVIFQHMYIVCADQVRLTNVFISLPLLLETLSFTLLVIHKICNRAWLSVVTPLNSSSLKLIVSTCLCFETSYPTSPIAPFSNCYQPQYHDSTFRSTF